MANVHVSASQNRSGIVFMHRIEEGAASKSYGIAVAQLAGVPMPVVRRAKRFLARLEERAANVPQVQPDLFGAMPQPADAAKVEGPKADPEASAFIDRLAGLAIDDLTPRDALAKLYELANEARRLAERA